MSEIPATVSKLSIPEGKREGWVGGRKAVEFIAQKFQQVSIA